MQGYQQTTLVAKGLWKMLLFAFLLYKTSKSYVTTLIIATAVCSTHLVVTSPERNVAMFHF